MQPAAIVCIAGGITAGLAFGLILSSSFNIDREEHQMYYEINKQDGKGQAQFVFHILAMAFGLVVVIMFMVAGCCGPLCLRNLGFLIGLFVCSFITMASATIAAAILTSRREEMKKDGYNRDFTMAFLWVGVGFSVGPVICVSVLICFNCKNRSQANKSQTNKSHSK